LEFNVPFQHKYGYIRDDLDFIGLKPATGITTTGVCTEIWLWASKEHHSFDSPLVDVTEQKCYVSEMTYFVSSGT